jgi:hypothetical protein
VKKKILFFSCEPGGAEVLIPVIKLVEAQSQYTVQVIGYGYAVARFRKKHVVVDEVWPISKESFDIFDNYVPDMLITSATSLPEVDMTEKYLWQQAKIRGVPSLAFLDQWQNYAIRFSGVDDVERLAYLPDWINCINKVGEQEMIEEGFDPQGLVMFGQPYLSSLLETSNTVDICEVSDKLNIHSGKKVFLFVSEAIKEYYGRSRGYDQHDAFRLFLALMSDTCGDSIILVKIHPKDSIDGYERILGQYPHLHVRIIKNEFSPIESILISDAVYGMTSVMLVESYILGKKTVSLQPGLIGEDLCVLSRHNMIPIVTATDGKMVKQLLIPTKDEFHFSFQQGDFMQFMNHGMAL